MDADCDKQLVRDAPRSAAAELSTYFSSVVLARVSHQLSAATLRLLTLLDGLFQCSASKSATRGSRADKGVCPTEQHSRNQRARRRPPGPGCARLSPLESGLAARIGCPTEQRSRNQTTEEKTSTRSWGCNTERHKPQPIRVVRVGHRFLWSVGLARFAGAWQATKGDGLSHPRYLISRMSFSLPLAAVSILPM